MKDKGSQQTDTGIIYEDGKPRIPTPDWRENKPGVAAAIQNAVRLPVYDFTTMINFMYSAAVRREFTGHI